MSRLIALSLVLAAGGSLPAAHAEVPSRQVAEEFALQGDLSGTVKKWGFDLVEGTEEVRTRLGETFVSFMAVDPKSGQEYSGLLKVSARKLSEIDPISIENYRSNSSARELTRGSEKWMVGFFPRPPASPEQTSWDQMQWGFFKKFFIPEFEGSRLVRLWSRVKWEFKPMPRGVPEQAIYTGSEPRREETATFGGRKARGSAQTSN